jgi:hypothetical protein
LSWCHASTMRLVVRRALMQVLVRRCVHRSGNGGGTGSGE